MNKYALPCLTKFKGNTKPFNPEQGDCFFSEKRQELMFYWENRWQSVEDYKITKDTNMTTKYFYNRETTEIFKIEGRDLKGGELKMHNSNPDILEISFDKYNELLNRRTGQSTRLIDKYIQELFTNGSVIISDHYDSEDADIWLLDRFLTRLYIEHRHTKVEVEDFKVSLK